jgi:hypothetical protein
LRIAAIRKFSHAPTIISELSCEWIATDSKNFMLTIPPIDAEDARIVAEFSKPWLFELSVKIFHCNNPVTGKQGTCFNSFD